MNTPRVTAIACRLIGGPKELQNTQVVMEKYHWKIEIGDEMGKSHTYSDLKMVNNEGELLFIHQNDKTHENT